MKELILCKYGEIVLKGLNRTGFEVQMLKNIRRRLKPLGEFKYTTAQSTLYIEPKSDDIDIDEAVKKLSMVYGIAKLSKAAEVEKDMNVIFETAKTYLGSSLKRAKTFKVSAKRSDKRFPLKSPEIAAELGGRILEAFPHLTVDVHNPDVNVVCEIRDNGAYVHGAQMDGAGGIPVGTSGRALLLLSGGIDSPVAGCMMAKRGVQISCIHFEAPPYTSERALLKVEKLAKQMVNYCGKISFFCVPFTKIQEEIKEHCPEELFTIIMRRLMMEIAQRVAIEYDFIALVTGESIGQVASQTMQAMFCTDAVCKIPVFRPCIGMDKKEIIDISYKIGTFDISIEPYEDCCTVFTPRHPKTRPVLSEVEEAQAQFDFEPLIQEAIAGMTAKSFKLEDIR